MFSMMANVRGSREYFSKMSKDVRWMIRQLGPPTLFVTCSMAEWFSEPFIAYLRSVNSHVPNVENMTAAELCAMDPVNVSIHLLSLVILGHFQRPSVAANMTTDEFVKARTASDGRVVLLMSEHKTSAHGPTQLALEDNHHKLFSLFAKRLIFADCVFIFI